MSFYARRRAERRTLYQSFQAGETLDPSTNIAASDTPMEAEPIKSDVNELKREATDHEEFQSKRPRINKTVKKQRRNKLLSRLIQPKPALMLLNEVLGNGMTCHLRGDRMDPPYTADAAFNGTILGTGSAQTKNAARQTAAEMALKKIVVDSLKDPSYFKNLTGAAQDPYEMDPEQEGIPDTPYTRLPWSTLASLALHRMFDDWKADGVVVNGPSKLPNPNERSGPTPSVSSADVKVPDDAHLMHPVSLLNQLHPGIRADELQRTSAPNSSVTVGYRINGQLYTGTATNGKGARKIAAAHACTSVYGISFS